MSNLLGQLAFETGYLDTEIIDASEVEGGRAHGLLTGVASVALGQAGSAIPSLSGIEPVRPTLRFETETRAWRR